MQSPINSIYSFYLSANVSRLVNQLTTEQTKAAQSAQLYAATITKYNLRPMFLVELANVLNGSSPTETVKLIPELYTILTNIQDAAAALPSLNGTKLTLLASDSKITLQSSPNTYVPRNQPRPPRAIPVTVDAPELQSLINEYISMVYPTFLSNIVTSAISTLEQNNLLNDSNVTNTSLRNLILFNVASGINVTKKDYDSFTTPGVKSNINLFYFSNFHPNSVDEDLTLGTLALIRHHVIQTPQTYKHILDHETSIIGLATFVSGKSGGLLKSETNVKKIKVNIPLIPSNQNKSQNISDKIDYSELILEGLDHVKPLTSNQIPPLVVPHSVTSDSDSEFTFDPSS